MTLLCILGIIAILLKLYGMFLFVVNKAQEKAYGEAIGMAIFILGVAVVLARAISTIL